MSRENVRPALPQRSKPAIARNSEKQMSRRAKRRWREWSRQNTNTDHPVHTAIDVDGVQGGYVAGHFAVDLPRTPRGLACVLKPCLGTVHAQVNGPGWLDKNAHE